MKPLSQLLDSSTVSQLRALIEEGRFPGITFEQAMKFALTDGIFPADDLPIRSFLALENWLRKEKMDIAIFTATDLKNKTGTILDTVQSGKRVVIERHGKPFVTIDRYKD